MTLALQVMFTALNKPEQILAAKVGGEKKLGTWVLFLYSLKSQNLNLSILNCLL